MTGSKGYRNETLSELVAEHFYTVADNMVRNGVIRGIAALHAKNLGFDLGRGEYSLDDLLKVCYERAHPEIYEFINKIRKMDLEQKDMDPIFDLVFNNIPQTEACLGSKLKAVLMNESMIKMVGAGKISFTDLISLVTEEYGNQHDENKFNFNKEKLNCIYGNCTVLSRIAELDIEDPTVLLTHRNTSKILQEPKLFSLIKSGSLKLDDALKLIPFKIKFSKLEGKSEKQQVEYLHGLLPAKKGHKHTNSISFNAIDLEDAFDDMAGGLFDEPSANDDLDSYTGTLIKTGVS